MDIHEIEKIAKDKTSKELQVSPEMQKLLDKQKKLKQEEGQLKDRIIKLKKHESEKKRKARTHRLVVLGAIIEDAMGVELPDGCDELEALVRCYLPQVRNELNSRKLYERLEKLREEDAAKKKAEEAKKQATEQNEEE